MSHTLILNQDFTPLSVIPLSTRNWQDAMRSWFGDETRPVEFYQDWRIHSTRQSWPVPSVLVCNKYIRKKPGVRYSRANLLMRDRHQCQYCGCNLDLQSVTVDHVVPRVKGGITRWENVVCACGRCNSIKGHKTHLKPRTRPQKPDYFQLVSIACQRPIIIPHRSWIPYLPWSPDLITVRETNR